MLLHTMNNNYDQSYTMGLQDFFTWRSQTTPNIPPVDDDEVPADVDEPPDLQTPRCEPSRDFHKSLVRPQSIRKESLLTKAFQKPAENEVAKPEIKVATDLIRRRSMMSNASLASTAELTSDGGFTSPARTNTPSPPFPSTTYTSFSPYSFASKPTQRPVTVIAKVDIKDSTGAEMLTVSPEAQLPVEAPPRKRCISFMCDGKKGMPSNKTSPASPIAPSITDPPVPTTIVEAPQPRKCTIKFACPGPKQSDRSATKMETLTEAKTSETQKRVTSRSPSIPRKSSRPALPRSTSNIRRGSHSPVAVRAKPKYIIADEKTINSSEATRFHEFASEEVQEDDWIRKDVDVPRAKLTINDTLQKENAIRRLGKEAEQEALEEDEEDEQNDGHDSEDEQDDEDEMEDGFLGSSDDDASDGNETDNEAGFAESDSESDGEEEFAFWTPGKRPSRDELSTYRPSAHRTASTSSIDSLNHMSPKGAKIKRRPIKIRPGTPDLPDSTDFVCGTLDEDRPLEDAYVSCMEARKHAKHKQTPQDIDPSFPTSDPEDEEDENDDFEAANDSEDHIWIHGRFEESDDERNGRRRSTVSHRKSPNHSPRRLHSPPPPKRLHSPPPAKHRLRSPPPRKLFGNSPRRLRSPPLAAASMRSPPGSPTLDTGSRAILFAPLGSRPGLTHTKSLPRTPNAFCRQYAISRLAAANGNDRVNNEDGHTRGAIDIVKGLEQKRQRRKEKFYKKNRGHVERRPQPGKGAERMRELGLLMAGKTGVQDPYMLSA